MSRDKRRKQEKRARRKREERERLRELWSRGETHKRKCPDCGDDCRDDKPTKLHRRGPCGASKEKVAATDSLIRQRRERWEATVTVVSSEGTAVPGVAPDFLPCLSCGRMIEMDDEAWQTCEGELLWIACDRCQDEVEERTEFRLRQIQLSWPEIQQKAREIEAEEVEVRKHKHERFVAPLERVTAQALGPLAGVTERLEVRVGFDPSYGPERREEIKRDLREAFNEHGVRLVPAPVPDDDRPIAWPATPQASNETAGPLREQAGR